MENPQTVSPATRNTQDPIIIHHSRKGAVFFGTAVVGFGIGTIGMFWYLKNEVSYWPVPIPVIVFMVSIYLVALHVLKHLLRDAGKVAVTIGPEGVKFDRYPLIHWHEIEDVYIVEDTDSPDSLWLKVKEGVTFLPDKPHSLVWLAKKTGLHRNIDISGYGSFTMSDKDIRQHIENGLRKNEKSN